MFISTWKTWSSGPVEDPVLRGGAESVGSAVIVGTIA
jgi:hypothetical protein